jgi:integrase
MIFRIAGVKAVRSKGHTYYYHRRTMVRLPGQPGDAEFMARLAQLEKAEDGNAPALHATLDGLIARYRASPEFTGLAAESRHSYQKVFDRLAPSADRPLIDFTRARLYALRDAVAAAHRRHAANYTITVLRLVFAWGIKRGHCDENPALGVDAIRRPRGAPVVNRPWRHDELTTVIDEAPASLRVAIALAAYTGLREGDIVRVTWTAYDGHAFETRAQKTGVPTWVPVHPRLAAILDAAPHTSPVIVLSELGRPFASTNSFRARFFALTRRLRDEGKIGEGLSFHGLRHTLGTALAEAGCDAQTIASVLGQSTTRMAEHYSRTANRRRLAGAAMERLEIEGGKTDGKPARNLLIS